MASRSVVYVPPDVPSQESTTEDETRAMVSGITASALVPDSDVGTTHQQSQSDQAGRSATSPVRTKTTALELRAPRPSVTTHSVMGLSRQKLLEKGYSERVITRLETARAASARKQYKSRWTYFEAWAADNQIDPTNPSLPVLANFLEHVFKERNVAMRTVWNYKAAIAHCWKAINGYEVPEDDPVIADLIKSFKRERPIPIKHVPQWDLRLVLDFYKSGRFANWDTLSDKELTLKTIFLMALATGKRRSELHAFSANIP